MALYHFHRVLIGAAVLFFFGFALYCARLYNELGATHHGLMTIGSSLGGVVLLCYLIYFHINVGKMKAHIGS